MREKEKVRRDVHAWEKQNDGHSMKVDEGKGLRKRRDGAEGTRNERGPETEAGWSAGRIEQRATERSGMRPHGE